MWFSAVQLLIGLCFSGQLFADSWPQISYQPERSFSHSSGEFKSQLGHGAISSQIRPCNNQLVQYPTFGPVSQSAHTAFSVERLSSTFQITKTDYTDPFRFNWSEPSYHDCQNKFANWQTDQILHQLGAYRYANFRQYAESLSEFENFILTMEPELERFAEDGCLSRELFLAHGEVGNQIHRYLRSQRDYFREKRCAQRLQEYGFSDHAVQLLRTQNAILQFNYDQTNQQQLNQFKQIKEHLNELAEYKAQYEDVEVLVDLAQESLDYTLIANRANQQKMYTISQSLLVVAKNALALGKGLVLSAGRNAAALIDPHTYKGCFDLIGQLGVSLADAAEHLLEFGLANTVNHQEILLELQQRRNAKYLALQNAGINLQQHLKQTWTEATQEQRAEMVGGLIADGAFIVLSGKINTTLLRTGGKILAPLGKYKPLAFAKLGELGREIHQVTGLAYTKGREYVQTGLDVMKAYPELAQIKKPLSATIRHCNKKIQAVNDYFQAQLRQKFYFNLQAVAAGVEGEPLLYMPPEKQLFLFNDGEIIKSKSGLIKPNGEPLSSTGSNLVHPTEMAGKILTEEEIFAAAVSGKTRENRIFFDHFGSKMVDPAACKEICPSIWDNSIFDKLKHPKCLKHYVGQIRKFEKQFDGITLGELCCGAANFPPEVNNLVIGVDYVHLLHPIPVLKCRNGIWRMEGFKGFYLDYLGKLEKSGEVAYKLIQELPGGAQVVEVMLAGALEPMKKTMFSQNLELVDVFEKFMEGCCNSIKWSISPTSGVISVLVETKDGLEIQAYFNRLGILETIFPFFKF